MLKEHREQSSVRLSKMGRADFTLRIELREFESGLVLTTQPPYPRSASPTAFPPPLSHHHSEAIPTIVPGLRRGGFAGLWAGR